jgi:hypothetical protein
MTEHGKLVLGVYRVQEASQYPCRPDAHASIRLAAIRGDAQLVRRILAESDEQLDVSKLTAVLHLLTRKLPRIRAA